MLGDPDGWSRQGAREAGGDTALDDALAEIDLLAALPHVKAVGETGLDHFRTGPDGKDAQERSFRAHIEIAKRHGKALVIHDRDAHDDVLRVLAEEGAPERTVFHCYSGDAAMARICAERGYYMSFAGNVTFKNAQPLRDALAAPRSTSCSSRPTRPSSRPPRTADGPTPVSHPGHGPCHGGGEGSRRRDPGDGDRRQHSARI